MKKITDLAVQMRYKWPSLFTPKENIVVEKNPENPNGAAPKKENLTIKKTDELLHDDELNKVTGGKTNFGQINFPKITDKSSP